MAKQEINIKDFKELIVNLGYEDIIDKYAKKAVKKLKNTNAFNRKPRKNPSEEYKKTWGIKVEKDKKGFYEVRVWNEKNWQLTHLLENGHQIVNKKGGVGWASAHPHIRPTWDDLKDPFITEMKNLPIKLTIK